MDVVYLFLSFHRAFSSFWLGAFLLYAILSLPSAILPQHRRYGYHLILSSVFLILIAGPFFYLYFLLVIYVSLKSLSWNNRPLAIAVVFSLLATYKLIDLLFASITYDTGHVGSIIVGVYLLRYIDSLRLKPGVSLKRWLLYSTYFPSSLIGPFEHITDFKIYDVTMKRGGILLVRGIAAGLIYILMKKALIYIQPLVVYEIYILLYIPYYGLEFFLMLYAYFSIIMSSGCFSGINFRENFPSFPYTSSSIREFWHNWNYTVMDFLRENIYKPLGGRRRYVPAVLMTFLFSALWHWFIYLYPGTPYKLEWFAIWGLYNALLFLVLQRIKTSNIILQRYILPVLITYSISVGWLFFGVPPDLGL